MMGTLTRRLLAPATATAALTMGALAFAATPALAQTPIQLTLSQAAAFQILGHSCGGISEHSYATGFAGGTTGYPIGDVYLRTSCSTGGRGAPPAVFTAWAAVTWDYTGAVISDQAVSAPVVSTSFSAYDASGNEVYNTASAAYLLLADGFAYPPRITAISTTQGPASGGTAVNITGTGFTGVTGVQFGTTPAAGYTVNSPTSITATAPAEGAGPVDITVTTAGGPSATSPIDLFTFIATPTVSSVSPRISWTTGGRTVTITGTNFTNVTSVDFGGHPAGFYVNSPTSITATSPSSEGEIGLQDVTVTNSSGTSPTSRADLFLYL